MKFDRRVTNGLAWAGLFVVVGVPAADLLSAQFLGEPQRVAVVSPQAPVPAAPDRRPAAPPAKEAVATVKPAAPVVAKPAPVQPVVAAPVAAKPAVPPVQPTAVASNSGPKPGDPVDAFLESGKKLPSYITEADAAVPAAPSNAAPAATVAAVPAPAAPLGGAVIGAPSAPAAPAPAPVIGAPPAPTASGADPFEVASLPPAKVAPVPMPLSMRPRPQQVPIASAPPRQEPVVIPPEVVFGERASVDAKDLEDWESGPLSEFLSQRESRGSDADFEQEFYPEEPVRPRRDRLIGPVDGGFFVY